MKIYQVGGAVRDRLLGKTPNDVDYVVVGSNPAEMISLGFEPVGKGFPVFLHPETKEEYALARKEIKSGHKHTDFEFVFDESITLHEDLERRDFTCNAIAYDETINNYIDPFGGREDIQKRILRHIHAEHFVEDPLRVLRLCRFTAQLGFDADKNTVQLCRYMVNQGMLESLSAERIGMEIFKALKTQSFCRFVEMARGTGTLKAILPEIEEMWQVEENTQYHPEGNTGAHVLRALQAAEKCSPLVKYGILLHDIGKILTPLENRPCHCQHENCAAGLIGKIGQKIKAPAMYRIFASLAAAQHMKFHAIGEMKTAKLFNLAEAMTVNHTCYVNEFIEVCRADLISTRKENKEAAMAQFEKNARLLKFCCAVLASIRAKDVPNFERLPKDESFNEIYRQYKINMLERKIKSFEQAQT